jgi:hypothetical protein
LAAFAPLLFLQKRDKNSRFIAEVFIMKKVYCISLIAAMIFIFMTSSASANSPTVKELAASVRRLANQGIVFKKDVVLPAAELQDELNIMNKVSALQSLAYYVKTRGPVSYREVTAELQAFRQRHPKMAKIIRVKVLPRALKKVSQKVTKIQANVDFMFYSGLGVISNKTLQNSSEAVSLGLDMEDAAFTTAEMVKSGNNP